MYYFLKAVIGAPFRNTELKVFLPETIIPVIWNDPELSDLQVRRLEYVGERNTALAKLIETQKIYKDCAFVESLDEFKSYIEKYHA